jgi:transcriptional regulator with XRE-family HTH domain
MNVELKNRILETVKERRSNFSGSDAKFATTLGISSSQYSRVVNGDIDRVLSDANWISIARKLEVSLNELPKWNVARTTLFDYMEPQLALCQDTSISLLLCDLSDIGKSFIARHYCKTHKNAVYIDCSQNKRRSALIRKIAKEFGVGYTGKYSDVYDDLVFYIKSLPNPLVILDEAGDLEYTAFLELKALWNATEYCCGWYMMGAECFKDKIEKGIASHKIGYPELFTRYNSLCQRWMPENSVDLKEERDTIVAIIAKANADPDMDIQRLVTVANGSPRRLYREIMKLRMLKAKNNESKIAG